MDRFLKYTSGREPVITINFVAAILFGAIVTLTERNAWMTWDEFSLTAFGGICVIAATWLARRGVFSPDTHAAEVEEALYTPVPRDS